MAAEAIHAARDVQWRVRAFLDAERHSLQVALCPGITLVILCNLSPRIFLLAIISFFSNSRRLSSRRAVTWP